MRRSDHGSGLGQVGVALLQCLGNPEVREHASAGRKFQENVVWLHIAVNHLCTVRKVERGGDVFCYPQRHIHRQLTFAPNASTERLSFDERHRVTRYVLVATDEENGNDIGVIERRRRPRLAPKAARQLRARHQIGVERFYGETTMEPFIANTKHDGRTAPPNQLLDPVMIAKRQTHLLGNGGHPVRAVSREHRPTLRAAKGTRRGVPTAFVTDPTWHRVWFRWSRDRRRSLAALRAIVHRLFRD